MTCDTSHLFSNQHRRRNNIHDYNNNDRVMDGSWGGGRLGGLGRARVVRIIRVGLAAGAALITVVLIASLFIISHPEFRDVLTARSRLLLGSIPDEPCNEARANASRWLLSSPVYEAGA